jgi:hypothetical protein
LSLLGLKPFLIFDLNKWIVLFPNNASGNVVLSYLLSEKGKIPENWFSDRRKMLFTFLIFTGIAMLIDFISRLNFRFGKGKFENMSKFLDQESVKKQV